MKSLLAAILVALLITGTATAKPSPGQSSIGLVGFPAYGADVTFTVSTAATNNPFVNLNCYQDGVLVMNSWASFFPGGSGQTFGLYSPIWEGGSALCRADLGMLSRQDRWVVLASTSFEVSA